MINFVFSSSRKRWVSQPFLRWLAQFRRKSTGRRGWVSPALELMFHPRAGVAAHSRPVIQLGMLLDKAVPWGQPIFGQSQHPFLEC